MFKEFESHLAGLAGYLKAIQRLSGVACSFGVRYYLANDDIEIFIKKLIDELNQTESLEYFGKTEIKYSDLISSIKKIIFMGALSKVELGDNKLISYLERVFIEDINEYYGLASNSLNKDGPFHPLIKGPVFVLDLLDIKNQDSLYYLVKIEGYYVLTYLRIRH